MFSLSVVFFFKQKTAYEMRISDWSSDVCSSDLIDEGKDPEEWPATATYARWLHREFCARLPAEMLWVENPDTGEKIEVVPGQLRTRDVRVGRHIPPLHSALPAYLARFDQAYSSPTLSDRKSVV